MTGSFTLITAEPAERALAQLLRGHAPLTALTLAEAPTHPDVARLLPANVEALVYSEPGLCLIDTDIDPHAVFNNLTRLRTPTTDVGDADGVGASDVATSPLASTAPTLDLADTQEIPRVSFTYEGRADIAAVIETRAKKKAHQ
ncbi:MULTISPECIES: hypothetical protein [Actinotignum]|uniref:Uncharacterized protein n=1 Tax=Actinotignum timonense TaxID=1870995 RepID=A0AAW9HAV9_9ACTO|nr:MULTISPECIES: hypothetical protein [Actinotignum]MDK8283699.1 hypothetical protein [Actinotignum timonense]MDY5127772.1 hypothetical protein [Actinotignum sp. SLA_B059]MDY5129979.1 hypothetical protein [Actinotignum timonense]MDY5140250.1 hypothetical protein [Actinotignum timonense]MDY5157642.1 hypothetical protein [Actinotignum timonense]